jgi:hypothetical protein
VGVVEPPAGHAVRLAEFIIDEHLIVPACRRGEGPILPGPRPRPGVTRPEADAPIGPGPDRFQGRISRPRVEGVDDPNQAAHPVPTVPAGEGTGWPDQPSHGWPEHHPHVSAVAAIRAMSGLTCCVEGRRITVPPRGSPSRLERRRWDCTAARGRITTPVGFLSTHPRCSGAMLRRPHVARHATKRHRLTPSRMSG